MKNSSRPALLTYHAWLERDGRAGKRFPALTHLPSLLFPGNLTLMNQSVFARITPPAPLHGNGQPGRSGPPDLQTNLWYTGFPRSSLFRDPSLGSLIIISTVETIGSCSSLNHPFQIQQQLPLQERGLRIEGCLPAESPAVMARCTLEAEWAQYRWTEGHLSAGLPHRVEH